MRARKPHIQAVVTDFSGTIATGSKHQHAWGRAVDPAAADALRTLHERGLRLILASNTTPEQSRLAALQHSGLADLFAVCLESSAVGVAKPDHTFYRMALAAAGCSPDRVLWVGDSISHDVVGPARFGTRTALIHPPPAPDLADLLIPTFSALPAALNSLK